jgi:tRNA (mo5U34)-methyltransferase
MDVWTPDDLRAKIRSFEYWHYPFDLGNGVTIRPDHAQEKLELRDFIWTAVLELCGGSLQGLRVLDIGCNAGFWSLEAYRSGGEYVLGIDPRPMHIEQAQLVRDAQGINPERLEYRQMSVYDLSRDSVGEFDLCLLLRVLQHLSHPLLALQRTRQVCRAYLVADIKLVRTDWPVFYLLDEDPNGFLQGDDGVALRPSRAAVELMLPYTGFTEVRVVPPTAPLEDAYFTGKRAVFTARVSHEAMRDTAAGEAWSADVRVGTPAGSREEPTAGSHFLQARGKQINVLSLT